MPDHVAGARSFLSDAVHGRARFFQIGRLAGKPHHARVGIGDNGGERLIYFVRDGRRQRAHRAHARYASELGLRFVIGVFRALALGHFRQQLFIGLLEFGGPFLYSQLKFIAGIPELGLGLFSPRTEPTYDQGRMPRTR